MLKTSSFAYGDFVEAGCGLLGLYLEFASELVYRVMREPAMSSATGDFMLKRVRRPLPVLMIPIRRWLTMAKRRRRRRRWWWTMMITRVCHTLHVVQDGVDDTTNTVATRRMGFIILKMVAEIECFRYMLLLFGDRTLELDHL